MRSHPLALARGSENYLRLRNGNCPRSRFSREYEASCLPAGASDKADGVPCIGEKLPCMHNWRVTALCKLPPIRFVREYFSSICGYGDGKTSVDKYIDTRNQSFSWTIPAAENVVSRGVPRAGNRFARAFKRSERTEKEQGSKHTRVRERTSTHRSCTAVAV